MIKLVNEVAAIADKRDGQAVYNILEGVYKRLKSVSLSDAGLVIKAGGSAVVKTGAAAWYGLVNGKLVTKAAATDMAALSGTVVNATFNVFVFTVNSAGTLVTTMGTAGASLATVKFPKIDDSHCVIGFVIINPTGTGNFVGGTTALDDATVVPNAVYIDDTGAVAYNAEI